MRQKFLDFGNGSGWPLQKKDVPEGGSAGPTHPPPGGVTDLNKKPVPKGD